MNQVYLSGTITDNGSIRILQAPHSLEGAQPWLQKHFPVFARVSNIEGYFGVERRKSAATGWFATAEAVILVRARDKGTYALVYRENVMKGNACGGFVGAVLPPTATLGTFRMGLNKLFDHIVIEGGELKGTTCALSPTCPKSRI